MEWSFEQTMNWDQNKSYSKFNQAIVLAPVYLYRLNQIFVIYLNLDVKRQENNWGCSKHNSRGMLNDDNEKIMLQTNVS